MRILILIQKLGNSWEPPILLGTPYSACLLAMTKMVSDYINETFPDEEIFYVIESGANGRKYAEDFLRRIQTSEKKEYYRLRGYTFIDKNQEPDGLILC